MTNKPDLLCVVPNAGPCTLHPLEDTYVEVWYWEKLTPLQVNLGNQWLLREGWIAAVQNQIDFDLDFKFESEPL